MRISKTIAVTAAVAIVSAAALFSKPVMAERAMLQLRAPPDSAMIANFEKERPYLAKWLTGTAKEKALEIFAKGKNLAYVAPVTNIPAAGKVREEDIKPLASNASEINSLYDQVNKYSDLSEAERAELGKKVAVSGDADLIDTYNEAKAKCKAPAVLPASAAKKGAKPAATGKGAGKTVIEETQAVVPVAPSVEKTDINALYDQVNKYSDLSETERAELGKKVAASNDTDLIDTYNEAKAKCKAPVVIPVPVETKAPTILPTPAAKKGATPAAKGKDAGKTVVEETQTVVLVAPASLAALKDSLSKAVNVCYDSINSMTPENYLETGINVGKAIEGIDAIIKKSFPKDDPWARYTMTNLKEYYADACAAMQGGKK